MTRRWQVVTVLFFVFFFGCVVFGGELYVPSGSYPTIQAGIDAAGVGDSVIVSAGTYYENIVFNGTDIILTSTDPNDWGVVGATIIDGGGVGRVVEFSGTETSGCELSGFTITNGYVDDDLGAGILGRNCTATISKCVIENNVIGPTSGTGGGLKHCGGLISGCIIRNNSAHYGGGMATCDGRIENCLVYGNHAFVDGGGIQNSDGDIVNCTVADNSADGNGGGVNGCDGSIINSIFWGNSAGTANQIYSSVEPMYSCVEGGSGGVGNISDDPLFVDPNSGDYHLLAGSLCIDGGTNWLVGGLPGTDIDGQVRPLDGDYDGTIAADIGVYESPQSPDPVISISVNSMVFAAVESGFNPADQTFSIINSGIAALNWSVSESCSWISVSPLSGSSTGEADTVTVSVEITGLTVGDYSCDLSVSDPGAVNSSQTVTVDMHVGSAFYVPSVYPTIQSGIDAAGVGDTVMVSTGRYYENIVFNGTDVILKSTNPDDWGVVAATIIDGGGIGRVVTFSGTETSGCVLSGFTIANGSADLGGGVHGYTSTATISRCIVENNDATVNGGGLVQCNGTVTNCIVRGNTAVGNGGGLNFCQGDIINCLIYDNISGLGGGIHNSGGDIVNCTIIYNTATTGGGLTSCDGAITSCIVWDNSPDQLDNNFAVFTYNCISGWSGGGVGNISGDPRLSSDGHLGPGSSCIDTGDPGGDFTGMFDIDHQVRVIDGRVDIGADESSAFIYVTKPVGGEVWAGLSSHKITWESFAYAGNVDLAYSTDNGTGWTSIVNDIADTGSYDWAVADVNSVECLISVTATTEPSEIRYLYSGLFTIKPFTAGVAENADWLSLGGSFKRTGLSSYTGPELGCVKWQFNTAGAVSNSITTGAFGRIHIASEDGILYTVNPNDGTLIWSYDTGSKLLSAPTVGIDGSVYVGAENGKLYAVDIDGQIRWTHETDGFIYSSPAVAADGTIFAGSADGKLYALGQDGSKLWDFTVDGTGEVTGTILASPAIGTDGSIYVAGLNAAKLYSIDPNNGSTNWITDFQYPVDPAIPNGPQVTGQPFASPVVAADGTIYMSLVGDEHLYAIDPADGSLLWSAATTPTEITGQWELDNNLLDSSGYEHHGTIHGDSTWVAGNTGSALYFDGVDNYVEISGYKGITGTDSRSVSAWIKTTYGGTIVSWGSRWSDGVRWALQVNTSTGQLELDIFNIILARGPDLRDGLWHHVKVELISDGSPMLEDVIFYIDGVPRSNGLTDTINTDIRSNVLIGARLTDAGTASGYLRFQGVIDQVVIERLEGLTDLYCYSEPVLAPDGTIYVSLDDQYLRAFDPNGTSQWVKRIGMIGGFSMTTGSDGNIYTVSDDDWLVVLDPSGNELSRFAAPSADNWISHPVITEDGTVLLSDTDNKVWAISSGACDASTADLHRPEDVTGDRIVGLGDFAKVAAGWLGCSDLELTGSNGLILLCFDGGQTYQGYHGGDIDRDNYSNINDLFMLLQKWFEQE